MSVLSERERSDIRYKAETGNGVSQEDARRLMESEFELFWEAESLRKALHIPCDACGSSGFSNPYLGTGYDAVCDCTGGYIGLLSAEDALKWRAQLKTAIEALRAISKTAAKDMSDNATLDDVSVTAVEALRNIGEIA